MTASKRRSSTARPNDLNLYYKNPRQGDVESIAASLRANDQYKPITVNIGTHTGRPNEVLAGNHTLIAVRSLAETYPDDPRWQSTLVHWIDVDDDRAARIVVADNRTGQLGGFDDAALMEILDSFGGDLDGVGYSAEEVADLAAWIEEQNTVTDKRTGDDGLINQKDIEELGDEYADKKSRLVVLNYAIPHFVFLQKLLAEYREEFELENNSDVLMHLIATHYEREIPDVPIEDILAAAEASPEVV